MPVLQVFLGSCPRGRAPGRGRSGQPRACPPGTRHLSTYAAHPAPALTSWSPSSSWYSSGCLSGRRV